MSWEASFVPLLLIGLNVAVLGQETKTDAQDFYNEYEKEAIKHCMNVTKADWNYQTNITTETQQTLIQVQIESAKFQKQQVEQFKQFSLNTSLDENLKRLFEKGSTIGHSILEEDKFKTVKSIIYKMITNFSTTKICSINNMTNCDLRLDPDLSGIMATSRDFDELLHIWLEWHNQAGRPIRTDFETYVELSNEAARLNNAKDTGDLWRMAYESPSFVEDMEKLWQELKPKYQQLHAYVRRKLSKKFGNEKIRENGLIPAHLLGNMWARNWRNIFELVVPYPEKKSINITDALIEKNVNAKELFIIAMKGIQSIRLPKLPDSLWLGSVYTRPNDTEMVCEPSTWNFYDKQDYRVKMCSEINQESFFNIYHESGHITYSQLYEDQPLLFESAANPGFYEAIGDVLLLSAVTPKELKANKLINDFNDDEEANINYLMEMALDKVAFLPFAYLVDKYRWEIFNGTITKDNYNAKWWEMRKKYQGIKSIVRRTESDFDPGALYHIAADLPYMKFFVSTILQFQLHGALCKNLPEPGPLHKCSIFNKKSIAKNLKDVMESGSSKSWQEALYTITGQKTLSTSSILEYFKPLWEFLEKENENFTVKWDETDDEVIELPTTIKPTETNKQTSTTNQVTNSEDDKTNGQDDATTDSEMNLKQSSTTEEKSTQYNDGTTEQIKNKNNTSNQLTASFFILIITLLVFFVYKVLK